MVNTVDVFLLLFICGLLALKEGKEKVVVLCFYEHEISV